MSASPLRIVFAGTPAFAQVQLAILQTQGYPITAVFTPPDRPVGRGRIPQPSPVKVCALEHGIPVYQPSSWKETPAAECLAALNPDLLIVSAYGFLLPRAVLSIPRYGCWNVHASLLPHWRGASPIQHAILAGDPITGVTLMQMAAGMDTGDMLLQARCPIADNDTTETLSDKLALLGGQLLQTGLQDVSTTLAGAIPQDASQASYCRKIEKIDGQIDWKKSAPILARQVRAFCPWPVAFFHWQDQAIRVWEAIALPERTTALPGTLLAITKQGLHVATGEGSLCIQTLQFPGKNPIPAHQTHTRWEPGVSFT